MIQDKQMCVTPRVACDIVTLRATVLQEFGIADAELTGLRIVRRSVDARSRDIKVNLTVRLYLGEQPTTLYQPTDYPTLDEHSRTAIVVGAGPAGLFAALKLIELGIRPIVIERGKDVHSRRRDIAQISRTHRVDENSNYGFGEGGAGAFSDGKLFTRSKKRGSGEHVLHVLCQHGASESILIDSHPHIGTDKLPRVIEGIRNTIIRCGGEVRFNARMTELLYNRQIEGVRLADGTELRGQVILATGHSARDIYEYLYHLNAQSIEAKGFAMGVRLEHPQALIDEMQYHNMEARKWLPAAEYGMVAQSRDRGVYSFCMCPGGVVVPAATSAGEIVVNGMSSSARGSKWANSGMVVQILPEDAKALGSKDLSPLSLMQIQRKLEQLAFEHGNRRQTAPAQRMTDFVSARISSSLPASSYSPGVLSSPLHEWLPAFIGERLQAGFRQFGRKYRGFLSNEALVIGVETRTSSPVRIIRDADTLEHPILRGLYPCGEGAGYAGGIVSAAVDGERCATALASRYAQS